MGVGIAVVGAAGAVWAQQTTPGTADGSWSALTAEVRALRVTIEEIGRRQTETQAIGAFLSAQQSRTAQLVQRLDQTRAEMARTQNESAMAANLITSAQQAMTMAKTPPEREEASQILAKSREDVARLTAAEQKLRLRENELYQAIVQDEGRWVELLGRLDAMIRR